MDEKEFIPLENILKRPERYYAHKKKDKTGQGLIRESLEQHTRLCQKYFKKLWEEKTMDAVLDRFIAGWFGEISKKGKNLFKTMVFNTVSFHDTGKCNPSFQKNKMETDQEVENISFEGINSGHSLISAVLYINYFKRRLTETIVPVKEERLALRVFLLLHSYIIARHHGDLKAFKDYLSQFVFLDEGENNGSAANLIEELRGCEDKLCAEEFTITQDEIFSMVQNIDKKIKAKKKEQSILLFCYTRLLFSLLTAADYYATTEFMSGVEIREFGTTGDMKLLNRIYEETPVTAHIREYEKEQYPQDAGKLRPVTDINVLRSEMFLDAERELISRHKENLFYLEEPTGGGKSNTAMNLSFQLLKLEERGKIYYVYPFNTLVEQNMDILKRVFGSDEKAFRHIAVVNSISPMKTDSREMEREEKEEEGGCYQKALLDRQFLNYPIVVTTHVSLFDTMFGNRKEAVFGFHQLINSVIVLDEIQSYKNTIWGEIITFFQTMAPFLNIKIIIMSATLPNLNLLTEQAGEAVMLIPDREKYFSHPCFRDRVKISYELLDVPDIGEALYRHVKENYLERGKKKGGQRFLVEFIKKQTAYEFYQRLLKDEELDGTVELMTGDDSPPERKRILDSIRKEEQVILVATQVMEAGVDIDMDVGYKDCSRLDSEEQFMGRINRSCFRNGAVYFFNLDRAKDIYGEDVRISTEFTLENPRMREILVTKDFASYYKEVLRVVRKNIMETSGTQSTEIFFKAAVAGLDFEKIKERMELIREDNWSMSVFLSRKLAWGDEELDGARIWKEYKGLLENNEMDYAEKRVRLSRLSSGLHAFIYQIRKNPDLIYHDRIGDILFIEDGEKFFVNGKLDRERLKEDAGGFVDFI